MSTHFLGAYYIFSHLFFILNSRDRYCYYFHFINEETKTWLGKGSFLRSHNIVERRKWKKKKKIQI